VNIGPRDIIRSHLCYILRIARAVVPSRISSFLLRKHIIVYNTVWCTTCWKQNWNALESCARNRYYDYYDYDYFYSRYRRGAQLRGVIRHARIARWTLPDERRDALIFAYDVFGRDNRDDRFDRTDFEDRFVCVVPIFSPSGVDPCDAVAARKQRLVGRSRDDGGEGGNPGDEAPRACSPRSAMFWITFERGPA